MGESFASGEPVIGFLKWLAARAVEAGIDKVADRLIERAALKPTTPQVRRHDLSRAGARATSDVDVMVRFHQTSIGRTPVILTFQKFGTQTDGLVFPMVLGDTAHLTLPRDHYLAAALVVALPTTPGSKPTLRGVGWSQPWIADNHTVRLTIDTQRPTKELAKQLGLIKPEGGMLFRIAPEQPVRRARVQPLQRPVRRQLTTGRPELLKCRAQANMLLLGRCEQPAVRDRLCGKHWQLARSGYVRDFLTGERIVV